MSDEADRDALAAILLDNAATVLWPARMKKFSRFVKGQLGPAQRSLPLGDLPRITTHDRR